MHRSVESLQSQPYSNSLGYRASNRTGSLEFGSKPVQYDDQGLFSWLSFDVILLFIRCFT